MEGDQELQLNDEILNLINFDIFEEIDFPLLPIACNNEVSLLEENSNTQSPNSDSSLIDEVEKYLMKDDDNKEEEEDGRNHDEKENFFSDFLLDIPIDQSVEPRVSNEDCSNPESNVSSDDCIEKESDICDELKDGENDDQISKKRKRQMRNRDAALRSRERKKSYVKDLEIKSRYLESECKRLQHLLQCYAAENQSLHHHLHLQKNKASGVSVNKQESAVLLLESLLLGSLLWFMGSICLFSLPGIQFHRPNPPPVDVLVSVGSGNLVEVVSLRAKNRRSGFGRLLKFFRRKRWKATRLRSKKCFPLLQMQLLMQFLCDVGFLFTLWGLSFIFVVFSNRVSITWM